MSWTSPHFNKVGGTARQVSNEFKKSALWVAEGCIVACLSTFSLDSWKFQGTGQSATCKTHHIIRVGFGFGFAFAWSGFLAAAGS